jgi:hypothetical protein
MGRPKVIPTKIYDFIDYEDTIIKHERVLYRARCPKCDADRGYKRPNKFNRICGDCARVYARSCITEESHKRQSEKIKGKIPWNKGLSGCYSEETRYKMGQSNKNKYKTQHQKDVRKSMSSLINQKLRKRGLQKSKSISKSLSYTLDELVNHLESKFQPGMTWENRGRKDGIRCWHIDHITPDSWFQYESDQDEEFKRCWALENLQPLWEDENMKKGNKYEG